MRCQLCHHSRLASAPFPSFRALPPSTPLLKEEADRIFTSRAVVGLLISYTEPVSAVMADADSDVLSTPPHHEINTPRLRLRTLYVSDAAALLPMLQQAEVMRWMKSGRPLPSLSVAERWVKDRALGQDVFNFAIELRTTPDGDNIDAPAVIIGVMGSFHWPRVGYVVHAGIPYLPPTLSRQGK